MLPAIDAADAGALANAVRQCRLNQPLLKALAEIYACADAEVAASGAVCLGGGGCCKFDLAGHRLYLSTAEMALLTTLAPVSPSQAQRLRCPYQLGPRCAARHVRPLGCRVFFCGLFSQDLTPEVYEYFHRMIRILHQTHCVLYTYTEITSSIKDVELLR